MAISLKSQKGTRKKLKRFSIKYRKLHNFTMVSRNLKLIKCSDFDILQFSSAKQMPMI